MSTEFVNVESSNALIKAFENNENGWKVRSMLIDGKPYFAGIDVAECLRYKKPLNAVNRHCPNVLSRGVGVQTGIKRDGSPAMQQVEIKFIPLGDVGRLIAIAANQSQSEPVREKAKKFESWLYDDVFTSIMLTGSYSLKDKVPQTFLEALKLAVQKEEERLALEEAYHAEQERADNAEREAKRNKDARDLQDQATKRRIGYDLGKAAKFLNVKDLGRNRLFKFLRDNGDFFYDRNGYNTVKQSHVNQKRFFEYIDETYEYPVIYITPKGMRYVLKELINAGYKPQITAEEWERKCQLDQEEEEE